MNKCSPSCSCPCKKTINQQQLQTAVKVTSLASNYCEGTPSLQLITDQLNGKVLLINVNVARNTIWCSKLKER